MPPSLFLVMDFLEMGSTTEIFMKMLFTLSEFKESHTWKLPNLIRSAAIMREPSDVEL